MNATQQGFLFLVDRRAGSTMTRRTSPPDFRPRCHSCGARWLPPAGVDAQVTPCPVCREAGVAKVEREGLSVHAIALKQTARLSMLSAEHEEMKVAFAESRAEVAALRDRVRVLEAALRVTNEERR